jgi:hypothetical protein
MSKNMSKKFLIFLTTILALNVPFHTTVFAKNLNMAVVKENVHPKMAGCRKKLETE